MEMICKNLLLACLSALFPRGGAWNQFDARCLVKRFQCNFYWQLFRRLALHLFLCCLHFILSAPLWGPASPHIFRPLTPMAYPQMFPANEIKSKYRCNCVNCANVWSCTETKNIWAFRFLLIIFYCHHFYQMSLNHFY